MKKIIVVLLVGFSLNAWSAKPGNRRPEKPGETGGVKKEVFKNFNNQASVILNYRVSLRTPDRLTSTKANEFQREAGALMEAIRIEARKPSFEAKRQDIVSILDSMNMGFATRSNLVEFIENNKNSTDSNTQAVVREAQELVGIIDNSFNILKSRVNDTTQNPVDGLKIADLFAVFGKVNGEYNARMVLDLVREIKSVVNNPGISLRKIALCK